MPPDDAYDLDEAEVEEAEREAALTGWARWKRVLTPVTREDVRIYRRFFQYLRPNLGKLALGMLLSILAGGMVFAQLVLMQQALSAIDPNESKRFDPLAIAKRSQGEPPPLASGATPPATAAPAPPAATPALTKEERREDLLKVSLSFLAVILLGSGIKFTQQTVMSKVARGVIRDVRDDSFKHVMRLPLRFHQRTHSGKIVARLTKDINKLRELMITLLISGNREIFVLLGALMYALNQTPLAALFALAFVIIAFIPVRIVADRLRHRDKSVEAGSGDMYAILTEAIAGQKVVKAFSAEKHEIKRFRNATKGMYDKQIETFRLRAMTEPLVDLIGGIGIAAGFWYLGNLVIDNRMTFGVVAAVIFALRQVSASMRKLGKMQNDYVRGMSAATRIDKILSQETEVREAPDAVPIENFRGSIEFRGVTFGFRKDQPVLKDISFAVTKGEMIAIVGPSGAGKTSLVDLLPRFFDVDDGGILIDGRDVRQYTLKSLRAHVGIVSQETMLFRDTIAENIAYGTKDATLEQVVAAAHAANAHDFIAAKPAGYETELGERGSRLSGGERQRIAIARALLKNPPILILDEATSALDAESEAMVQAALFKLMAGRTTLVIAHRLSTIRQARRIIVLDQGRIVEAGTHDELLQRNGRYARAYRLQMDALSRGEHEGTIDDFFSE